MNLDELDALLRDTKIAHAWLKEHGIVDLAAGRDAMITIANGGISRDGMCGLAIPLATSLPTLSNPDLALATLARFVSAAENPASLATLWQQENGSLANLLQLFSTSPVWGDYLVTDVAAFDSLRATEGEPTEPQPLLAKLLAALETVHDVDETMRVLRSFKRREILRIAYGDVIGKQPTQVVTQQLTMLADTVCEAALQFAMREQTSKRGQPSYGKGQPAKLTMLGLRRFGGQELDYQPDLDVLFIYDQPGRTRGDRPVDNHEFFSRVANRTVHLLGDETDLGIAYRLNTQRATAFCNDQPCGDIGSALRHFDSRGRTWERLALVKARPVAGAVEVGFELLDAIEPWVYRRYLSRSDISGIRALNRRLVKRSDRRGLQLLDVEGGVLDVEFAVQFLQLIAGSDDRQIRVVNTLHALQQLEQGEAITDDESRTLQDNYQWLRRVEHRLEVLRDSLEGQFPNQHGELRRLAISCGYDSAVAAPSFQSEYEQRIGDNQDLITRLLTEAFDEGLLQVDAETDLVMDPDPRPESIQNILSPYGFRDATDAYHNLSALGQEKIPFLSARRCRYFLSLISKPLLWAISKTPTPDATLANLVRVSDSLGGKGVLWELFHSHRPSLDLYVRLCSSSPYLTAILTRYPGMIDELLDSLMLADLPSLTELQSALEALTSATDNLDAILHSFKNTQHLNVGVRELLGKADIQESTAALSDVAEACLQRVADDQNQRLLRKLGTPRIADEACGLVILGMGKLGGREPNYHSDLDFVTVFEGDGETYHPPAGRHRETTTNQHYFAELTKRIIKAVSENGPNGKLYDSDPHLSPIGKAGPASVSLERFRSHYLEQPRPFAEMRRLCRARPVFGPEPLRAKTTALLQKLLTHASVTELDSGAVVQYRRETQSTAGPRNLKRGPGGTMDVEFIAEVLQLRNASQQPDVLATNTLQALQQLAKVQIIDEDVAEQLGESYRFLRRVEAMLRLLNTTARHDLPREGDELAKLAYLMRFEHAGQLERECAKFTKLNRSFFDQLM